MACSKAINQHCTPFIDLKLNIMCILVFFSFQYVHNHHPVIIHRDLKVGCAFLVVTVKF